MVRPKGVGVRQLTTTERHRVRVLYFDALKSQSEIMQITGYTKSQIRHAIRAPSAEIKPRSGRPRGKKTAKEQEPPSTSAAGNSTVADHPTAPDHPTEADDSAMSDSSPMADNPLVAGKLTVPRQPRQFLIRQYLLRPTPHVPNSRFPVVVYHDAVAGSSPEGVVALIQGNKWTKGGQWRGSDVAHFHSNTHECYAVLRGRATYLLGKSPIDAETDDEGNANGIRLEVSQGDVLVLPAGTSHCQLASEDDFEFAGFYPEDAPHWDMNYCKDSPEETGEKALRCAGVPVPPHDPLFGSSGPLPQIWQQVSG